MGLQAGDATIAELLKRLGYATAQFGKSHLGNRNEYLPTVHRFDEFFGNLYHLNAEEEPERPNRPRRTFTAPRVPKLFDLRTVPFERADITSNTYYEWFLENDYIALAATGIVTQFLETFKDFPPCQKADLFTSEQAMEKMAAARTGGGTSTGKKAA